MRLVVATGFAVLVAVVALTWVDPDLNAEAQPRATPRLEVGTTRCAGKRKSVVVRIVRSDVARAEVELSVYDGTARRSHRIGHSTQTLKRARSIVTVRLDATASILSNCAIRTGRTLTVVAHVTPLSGRSFTLRAKRVGATTTATT